MTSSTRNFISRATDWLAIPLVSISAGVFFLAALHNATTTFRIDRGWSQQIPAFGAASLAGLMLATAVSVIKKRPLADARAIVTIVVGMMTFAYFSGELLPHPLAAEMGHHPDLHYWYLGGAGAFAATMAWIVPVRPFEGFLLASIAFASPATRLLLRWWPDGFDVAPIALALAAAAQERFSSREPFRWPRLATPALVFVISVFCSAIFSTSQQIAWPAFGRTALQFAGFAAAVSYFRGAGGASRFVHMAAVVCAAVAASELYTFLRFAEIVGFGNARLTRLESFDIHPNLSAPFSMVGSLVCLGSLICSKTLLGRGLSALGFVTCGISLILHKSGGATLGAAAGAAMIVGSWIAARTRFARAAGAVGAFAIGVLPILLFLAALLFPLISPRLRGGGESGKVNIATRVEFWPAARDAMLARPIFGNGPRNVEAHAVYVEEAVEANIDWSNHPHNIFLELGETLGFAGVAAFFIMLIAAGREYRRAVADRGNPHRSLAMAGGGVLAAIIVDGFVDHGFAEFAVVTDPLWWALAWIAIAAPGDDAGAAQATNTWTNGWLQPILKIATSAALVIAGVIPIICTELEQSVKWLHYWATSGKYDSFHDTAGREGRLEALLTIAPSRADMRVTYAETLLAKGPAVNFDISAAEVERAVADAQHNSEVVLRAAMFYANAGPRHPAQYYKRARELYQSAASLGNPGERAQAHLGLARCAAATDNIDAALRELSTALSMSPALPISTFGFRPAVDPVDGGRDVTYWLGGQNKLSVLTALKRGVARLRADLDKNFDTIWGPLSRLGECYIHISRPDLAIAIYQDVEASAPSARMNLPSALGQARIVARQYKEAIDDIDRAVKIGGWHPVMSALRAKALDGLGRGGEAMDEADKFYKNPMDVISCRGHARDALNRMAQSKQNATQFADAARFYREASIYEDNLWERIRLQANAVIACSSGYRQTLINGYLFQLDENIDILFDRTGTMQWPDFDKQRFADLGKMIGDAAAEHAPVIFDRCRDRIEAHGHPSAAAWWIVIGIGNSAIETTKTKDAQAAQDISVRVDKLRDVAFGVTARLVGLGGQ